MVVTINQPAYLPWLGYLDRIALADLHIVLDHVQFEKNSFVNRNRIRTAQGWAWLTVPVRTKGRFGTLAIRELETDGSRPWARKHWESIRQSYAHAAHFPAFAERFQGLYEHAWPRFTDLARECTRLLREAFGIRTPIVYSSDMDPQARKSELVLELCRKADARKYVSGPLGRDYLDRDAFARHGIELAFHDYAHPRYPQAYPGFEANMAAIDALFNCGAGAAELMRGGRRESPA
jgi:hypothetical protein